MDNKLIAAAQRDGYRRGMRDALKALRDGWYLPRTTIEDALIKMEKQTMSTITNATDKELQLSAALRDVSEALTRTTKERDTLREATRACLAELERARGHLTSQAGTQSLWLSAEALKTALAPVEFG